MGRGREGGRGDTALILSILKRPSTRPVGHYSHVRDARFTVLIKVSVQHDKQEKTIGPLKLGDGDSAEKAHSGADAHVCRAA